MNYPEIPDSWIIKPRKASTLQVPVFTGTLSRIYSYKYKRKYSYICMK